MKAADFTVAPNGRDANPGTQEKPFATLTRARNAVREMKTKGLKKDVLVQVRAGTYFRKSPLVFGPRDSGTETHSITCAAFPGGTPVLSGGRANAGHRTPTARDAQDNTIVTPSAAPKKKEQAWIKKPADRPARARPGASAC